MMEDPSALDSVLFLAVVALGFLLEIIIGCLVVTVFALPIWLYVTRKRREGCDLPDLRRWCGWRSAWTSTHATLARLQRRREAESDTGSHP